MVVLSLVLIWIAREQTKRKTNDFSSLYRKAYFILKNYRVNNINMIKQRTCCSTEDGNASNYVEVDEVELMTD